MSKNFLEDYHVGETFTSPSRTMTETDIVNFAMLTGDWNPLHTDADFAATSPFGERIAHGLLVLSVGSALAFRLGPYVISPKSFIALYGFENISFKKPVKIGESIHLNAEVLDIEMQNEERGLLIMRNRIVNSDEHTCVEYTTRYLCGRK